MDVPLAPASLTRLVALLTGGGDARLALDPVTARNKYHCPLLPAPGLICFSSCTASPLSEPGLAAAAAMLRRLDAGATVQEEACAVAAELVVRLRLGQNTTVLLAPSGTDAFLLAMGLLVAERPGVPLTSIMVAASETGSGVPLAAAGRHFSELTAGGRRVRAGGSIAGFPAGMQTRAIPLREADGAMRPAAEIDAAFAAAVAEAPGRAVVHLIDGSKTGLVAPTDVPSGTEVVVDACQARLPLDRLRDYLDRGWPVLISGSKFFGGPAFSGAVLFPADRLAGIDRTRLPAGLAAYGVDRHAAQPAVNAGALLRWAAALEDIRPFPAMQAVMDALCQFVANRVAERRKLLLLPAAQGIVPFAILGRRLLGMAELRRRHRALADAGFLLGQPVEIGATFGALRIAIGARTLHDPQFIQRLERCLAAITA
jgi:hypothetical protein